MPIKILRKDEQEKGSFNAGGIRENRPVVLSNLGKSFKPYSSLFYWAHAWSDEGSLLEEHPHQAFEILSFVLKGEIEHFDTKNKDWKKLSQGSVQIIRAGSGISHAEKFKPGSEIFQIWFDPDIEYSLNQAATYNDYPGDKFYYDEHDGVLTKLFKGEDAPIKMKAEVNSIKEVVFTMGEHNFKTEAGNIYSIYIISGEVEINNEKMSEDDFMRVTETDNLFINAVTDATMFIIETPVVLNYKTYLELYESRI